jgi:hypothetical protein
MTLLLQHRWEHALVGAVVEAAKSACPTCYLGRTAIQKLVYFLHVLEVPMQFTFRIHHFGPFCDDLAGVLDWLQADDIVVDDSREPRYSDFSPAANWPQIKATYQESLHQYQGIIDSVARALGSMEPRILELIATLDFSFRWVRARGGNGPWKEPTIHKFKEIKGDKFSNEEILRWHASLVKSNLIED